MPNDLILNYDGYLKTYKEQSVTFQNLTKVAIIKHKPRGGDSFLSAFYSKVRNLILPKKFAIEFYPDTIVMQDQPKGTLKGHTIPVLDPWWSHLEKINSPQSYEYTRSVHKMWINIEYRIDGKIPQAESIHCGGNYVTYDVESSTHIHLVAYPYTMKTNTLDPNIDNWHFNPHKFWKACAINSSGQIINVGNNRDEPGLGLDVYFPLLKYGEVYLPKTDVEFFPALPANSTYELRGMDVYLNQNGSLSPLMTTTTDRKRTYYTDWFRLETVGVVPPY